MRSDYLPWFLFVYIVFCTWTFSYGQKKPARVLQHPEMFQLEPQSILNSPYRETNLSITPDGRQLFFMSDRGGQLWSEKYGKYKGKKIFDGDIWFSERGKLGWGNPICLDSTINSSNGEDEPMVSPDAQVVIFQRWKDDWKQTGGPYYIAELSGRQWGKAAGLGGGINRFFIGRYNRSKTGYATDGAAMSPDGQTFIVACGEEYDGKMDLYVSKKVNTKWQTPKRMAINTEGDERSVFMAGDGQTIFFASDGYEGFGGLDIYKTTLRPDGTVGEVINIGEPFNTKEDDYGFIMSASGNEAFFVRNGDIYAVDIRRAHPELKPLPVLIISGTLTDTSGNGIETYLNLLDDQRQKVLATSKSNAETGAFSFSVSQLETAYRIQDRAMQYIDTVFQISSSQTYSEWHIDVIGKNEHNKKKLPIKSDTLPELTNRKLIVYFDFNQAELSDTTQNKVSDAVKWITSYPHYSVAIEGHTDSKGSLNYNDTLSNKRAMAVRDYLETLGVDSDKIVTRSYGEKRPASSNRTEQGRDKNRRVVIIFSVGDPETFQQVNKPWSY